jgi:hypothetical protein
VEKRKPKSPPQSKWHGIGNILADVATEVHISSKLYIQDETVVWQWFLLCGRLAWKRKDFFVYITQRTITRHHLERGQAVVWDSVILGA